MNHVLFLEGSSDEGSESSIDVVEGHEVVLKTSSEKTTSDDPDYLQLLEAHQQRLEDAASGNVFNIYIITFTFKLLTKQEHLHFPGKCHAGARFPHWRNLRRNFENFFVTLA